jgi:hypothetical protein
MTTTAADLSISRPAIDLEVPSPLQTATFAMG